MHDPVLKRLQEFVPAGWSLKEGQQLVVWRRRLYAFLQSVGEDDLLKKLRQFEQINDHILWTGPRDDQVSFLEGHLLLHSAQAEEALPVRMQIDTTPRLDPRKVFLVHGHDDGAKESAARFLERLDLEVIILHEQANQGQTVIEKFESNSNVGFAVVLLTPDDIGASAKNPELLQGRARQNVVLELGYFTGKLGRSRVAALFRPGVEIPSDFHGVLFIELDSQGGWKAKVAQELVSARMQINLQGLLRTT